VSVPTKSTEANVEETVLPPGQRDGSGFWSPAGYSDPKTLVRTRRRRLKNEAADAEKTTPDTSGQ
jgi:hypothetical protein